MKGSEELSNLTMVNTGKSRFSEEKVTEVEPKLKVRKITAERRLEEEQINLLYEAIAVLRAREEELVAEKNRADKLEEELKILREELEKEKNKNYIEQEKKKVFFFYISLLLKCNLATYNVILCF